MRSLTAVRTFCNSRRMARLVSQPRFALGHNRRPFQVVLG